MGQRHFVVLDRDGTIIVERHYLSDPDEVKLEAGAGNGLRRLREMGLGLVVITNQSTIGSGLLDQARLDPIHQRLRKLLESEGIELEGIYYCPHLPETACLCRKPNAGLLELVTRELGFEPGESFVVGDKACDVELGRRVGATTFLVRTGYGARVAADGAASPDYVVDGLNEAARAIEGLLAAAEESGTDEAAR